MYYTPGHHRMPNGPLPSIPTLLAAYALWCFAWSSAAMVVYGVDKHRAAHGRTRTPERTLHTLGLLGGWPGGLLAMRLFKHKRRKAAFVRAFWLTVVGHLAVVGITLFVLAR